MLGAAKELIALLPAEHVGQCVLTREGRFFTGDVDLLQRALAQGELSFHAGHIGGAFPTIVGV